MARGFHKNINSSDLGYFEGTYQLGEKDQGPTWAAAPACSFCRLSSGYSLLLAFSPPDFIAVLHCIYILVDFASCSFLLHSYSYNSLIPKPSFNLNLNVDSNWK